MGIYGGSDGIRQAVADPQADHFSRKDVIYNKAAIYNKHMPHSKRGRNA